jgi:hypothetical protein
VRHLTLEVEPITEVVDQLNERVDLGFVVLVEVAIAAVGSAVVPGLVPRLYRLGRDAVERVELATRLDQPALAGQFDPDESLLELDLPEPAAPALNRAGMGR